MFNIREPPLPPNIFQVKPNLLFLELPQIFTKFMMNVLFLHAKCIWGFKLN